MHESPKMTERYAHLETKSLKVAQRGKLVDLGKEKVNRQIIGSLDLLYNARQGENYAWNKIED
jgi:hypothetical protein